MGKPRHETMRDADLPGRSDLALRCFRRYARPYVARRFHAVRVLRPPDLSPLEGRPVIVYLNHPSWWDPMLGLVLNDVYFSDRRHFSPIEASMLHRYRFFRRLGFFGVEPGSRLGGLQLVRTGARLLADPRAMMWITAEGQFTDPRARPVALAAGTAHLAARLPDVALLPLALEYPFWTERLPEALAHFGRPLLPHQDAAASAAHRATNATLHETMRTALAHTMDELADAAIAHDARRFTTLLHRRVGVGGIYEHWQRLRAWSRGRSHRPGHLETEV